MNSKFAKGIILSINNFFSKIKNNQRVRNAFKGVGALIRNAFKGVGALKMNETDCSYLQIENY